MNTLCHAYAEINLGRLVNNYKEICRRVFPARVMCVVKANAYGHGMKRCAAALYAAGANAFAVATAEEAVALREYVGDSDILVLSPSSPSSLRAMLDKGIIQTISSLEYAALLMAEKRGPERLPVHIKIDTGMNRIGFSADEKGVSQIAAIAENPGFDIRGVFSHFACSDEPSSPLTDIQKKRFDEVLEMLRARGIECGTRHISNSAAALSRPDCRYDLVRCGIVLYGQSPSPETPADGFLPVMSFKTSVTHVHMIKKGDKVSYGATFTAKRDMTLATLSVGYADGFIRGYSGATVVIEGKKAPIVGRVCMDQCMADITGIDAGIGSVATLFGDENPLDGLSHRAGTINYESLCIISPRVPRIYL